MDFITTLLKFGISKGYGHTNRWWRLQIHNPQPVPRNP